MDCRDILQRNPIAENRFGIHKYLIAAIVGTARPGDIGFDVVHLNLHKTFSTAHGGGPGAGPILVGRMLEPFLPAPIIVKENYQNRFCSARADSIGHIAAFHGNVGIILRAFAYLLTMGADGLRGVSQAAVLNANYLKERLKMRMRLPHDALCKHEFVLSSKELKDRTGVSAMDIAERLLDFNVYAPTVYFRISVPEAIMVEPTETEFLETLDYFAEVFGQICDGAMHAPEILHEAPHATPIRRVDEVSAARHPKLKWSGDPDK